MFSTTSKVLKKWFYNFHSNCQNSLSSLLNSPMRFFTLDITRRKSQNFYSLETLLFFRKFVFSTTSYVLRKWSYKFHSSCQKSWWTVTNWSLKFLTLDNTGNDWPKSLSLWKHLFFEIVCFYRPLGSKKMIFKNAQKCQNTFWTLVNYSLGFVKSDKTRKSRPRRVPQWNGCLFF